MVEQTLTLDQILQNLSSDESKAEFILKLSNEDVSIPDKHAQWAIDHFLARGDDWRGVAANLARDAGRTQQAIELYRLQGEFYHAIVAASDAGLEELADQLVDEHIFSEVAEGNYSDAADIAEEAGRSEQARELKLQAIAAYEQQGDILSLQNAGCVCREIGEEERAQQFYQQVVELYIQAQDILTAARVAKEGGLTDHASRLYVQIVDDKERLGSLDSAANIAVEGGMFERAVELYLRAKSYQEAAAAAVKCGNVERALEILIEHERYEAASKIAVSAGLVERGIDILVGSGLVLDAAELAQEHDLHPRARELFVAAMNDYEKDGEYAQAEYSAREAGLRDKETFYKQLQQFLEHPPIVAASASKDEDAV